MSAYYNFMFKAFANGSLMLGALLIVLCVWLAAAWAVSQFITSRHYWHTLKLAINVMRNGKDYPDRFFWQMLDERLKHRSFDAKFIISRAQAALDKEPTNDKRN